MRVAKPKGSFANPAFQVISRPAGRRARSPRAGGDSWVAKAIPVLKALSDPTRFGLVECLLRGERCVSDLTSAVGLRQPRVSHHLGILRKAKLVVDRRAGKKIFYRLNPHWFQAGPPPGLDLGPIRLEFKL